ncbi:MAG TPA: hypothetical protein VD838_15580, partial [Anaeromyxobacteraceae bacterium]|nr:hypothetical protein [Anaeromyxobacteraceae bacterium]
SGDGEVTLTEAFRYARQQTIRDTARHAREPQHPSFALNLRGRQDVVLAQIAASPSRLSVEQADGPLELVHLGSGLRVLELPPGARRATLAVPPGRYLVRRIGADGVRTHEVVVPRTGATTVREAELELVTTERLAVKGTSSMDLAAATPAKGEWEVTLGAVGSSVGSGFAWQTGTWAESGGSALRVDGRVGLGMRTTWKIGTLAFAWRFGSADGWELVPWAGAPAWSATADGLSWRAGVGLGLRRTWGPTRLLLTGSFEGDRLVALEREWNDLPRPIGRFRGGVGFGFTIARAVDVHLAAGVVHSTRENAPKTSYVLGSAQELGLAAVPLLRVRVRPGVSVDLHASRVLVEHRDVEDGSRVVAAVTTVF